MFLNDRFGWGWITWRSGHHTYIDGSCSVDMVDVGNLSKKSENMEGIITWNIFTGWFFNRTLSIYNYRNKQFI